MSALRVVAYAINGRGMGHLVRQLAILRWVRRYAALLGVKIECWVLTSSEADTLARREGFPSLKIPSKSMVRDGGLDPVTWLPVARSMVLNLVATLQPDLLLVDTFPGGSFGELVVALELARRRVLVARPVRPEIAADAAWQALLPLYHRVIVPGEAGELTTEKRVAPILIREREEVMSRAEARVALGIPDGARACYLTLGGGGDPNAESVIPRLIPRLRAAGWHVVVGAGPLYQGAEVRGEGITWLDRPVAMELLPGADVAVSAGGYNSFHELMYLGIPTVFLPQPRLADDQSGRVARAVAAGAGRLAPTVEEIPALLESAGDGAKARALVPLNGASEAAAEALSLLLPAEDVAAARAALTPAAVGALSRAGLEGELGLALVRLLGGERPSRRAEQKAVLLELADAGHVVPSLPAAAGVGDVAAFLQAVAAVGAPAPMAVSLVQQLARRFPAGRPAELVTAMAQLLPVFARFEDWMGAVALIRAIPVQRQYRLATFVEDLVAWLAGETDLYDAQRRLAQAEGAGRVPVAEVLRMVPAAG